jgi:hypothetical protein
MNLDLATQLDVRLFFISKFQTDLIKRSIHLETNYPVLVYLAINARKEA